MLSPKASTTASGASGASFAASPHAASAAHATTSARKSRMACMLHFPAPPREEEPGSENPESQGFLGRRDVHRVRRVLRGLGVHALRDGLGGAHGAGLLSGPARRAAHLPRAGDPGEVA